MKIAIIIPTFNRSEKIRICLQNLISFRALTSHHIDIIICNNQSTDDTIFFLNEISIVHPFIKPYTREKFEESGHESAVQLINEVSQEYDWYWLFGDDDLIEIENIEKFDAIISKPEIDYIYAPTYYKKINDHQILDNVKGLADYFGLIDLFGFFSSQIFSNKALLKIKNSIRNVDHDFEFCFIVPVILYESIHELNGYVGTEPWVKNINDTPSDGSAEPWFSTAHYFQLASDKNIIKFPKNKEFFLSEKRFIWRNFICWIISHAVNNKTIANLHYKDVISKTISLCNDKSLISNENFLLELSFKLIYQIYSGENFHEKTEADLLPILNEIYLFLNQENSY